jgi:protein involved in polysaccharide export with SLBB domain
LFRVGNQVTGLDVNGVGFFYPEAQLAVFPSDIWKMMIQRDLPLKKMTRSLLVAAAAVLLTGCGAGAPPLGDGVTLKGEEDVLVIGALDSTYIDPSYRLAPGDIMAVDFLFDRSLNAQIMVRPDGGINLPILGDMIVSGKTPGDLARQISEAYGRYYTNPQLSINLTKFAPPQVYVLGEVNYPKAVIIRPGMTVLSAIAEAGGQTASSNLGSTVLIRRVGMRQAVARRFDAGKFAKGKGVTSDLFLQDYDIIYVPRSFIASLARTVDLVFNGLMPIPLLYLRGWEAFNTDRVYNRPTTPNNTQQATPSSETP